MGLIRSFLRIVVFCGISSLNPAAVALDDDAGLKPSASKDANVNGSTQASSPQKTDSGTSLPGWLRVGAVVRGRYETPSGTSVANSTLDEYYLSRLRLDMQVKPAPWLSFIVQAQDVRGFGYNAPAQPSSIYDPLDLRLGYVELSREASIGVKLRAGRQELNFGSGRLLATPDWGNSSRSYDAVDLTFSRGGAKLDLIAGSVVLLDPSRLDRHKPGEHLYGAYASISDWLPKTTIEPFLLFKQSIQVIGELGGVGDALLATPGFRLTGQAPKGIDYTAEFAIQRGSYAADRASAMAGSYVAGWTAVNATVKLRFSVEYSHASGDKSARDGSRGTFDQLYAANHQFYGIADQVGWRNIRNPRIGCELTPTKRIKLRSDFNEFYLATVLDGLYNAGGARTVLNTRASSSHVGSEIDFQAQYQWSPALQFGIGFARLFAGAYLRQSTSADGYSYPYIYFTKRL